MIGLIIDAIRIVVVGTLMLLLLPLLLVFPFALGGLFAGSRSTGKESPR